MHLLFISKSYGKKGIVLTITDLCLYLRHNRATHVTLNMTYHSTGSGTGKQTIMGYIQHSPPVSYVGSDIPLLADEQERHPDLKAFPVMAG